MEEVQDPLTHEFVPERTYGCLPADEQGGLILVDRPCSLTVLVVRLDAIGRPI